MFIYLCNSNQKESTWLNVLGLKCIEFSIFPPTLCVFILFKYYLIYFNKSTKMKMQNYKNRHVYILLVKSRSKENLDIWGQKAIFFIEIKKEATYIDQKSCQRKPSKSCQSSLWMALMSNFPSKIRPQTIVDLCFVFSGLRKASRVVSSGIAASPSLIICLNPNHFREEYPISINNQFNKYTYGWMTKIANVL